ncbi:ParB/RepB/Spo0J family partition protein [Silvanigrella sp.]|jgi:ParB/RepB/Spo0J family partition protein|uniref:ParB/RepB/Spo0J family partition protein n=1 Tax=Silvanigrella sp. TaxID=2024976 RepID=UPI0037C54E1F
MPEPIKNYQQSNKEILAEKKLKSFTETIYTEPTFTIQQPEQLRLEKIRSAINKVFYLNPSEILLSENVRFSIDTKDLEYQALKNSIATEGILQPVVVELRDEENKYELIAINGHRRILAAKELGIDKILCVIKKYSEKHSRLLHGLTENLLRTDLDPLDVSEGYAKLIELGWRAENISEYFGKDLNYVYCIIKLASYSDQAKSIIRENKEKFPMRILINEFARKKWTSDQELIEALLNKVEKKSQADVKSLKVEMNKKQLNIFYDLNPDITDDVKMYVEKALRHFKFIN